MAVLRIRLDKTAKSGELLKCLNCNLACIWCHGDFFKHKLSTPAISNEKIVDIVKATISASTRQKVEVKISGQGEPCLVGVEELCDLIKRLRQIPKVSIVKLLTNGILLEGMLPDLVAAGLNSITVSINSLNPKVYAEITSHDDLECALKAVNAAVEMGLKTKINAVYTKLNSTEVLDYIRFSGEHAGLVVKFFDLLITKPICKDLYLPLSDLQRKLAPLATSVRTLLYPYRADEYHFLDVGAIIQVKTAGGINECPNTGCQYRNSCLEGCRSAVRISQDGTLHPCGVRTDNVITFKDRSPSIEMIKVALHSGGKNGDH
jgi:molybdenum cofactor biosynthesis enzyme MoaA